MKLIKKHNVILNLELKGEAGKNEQYWDDIVDIAVKEVHKHGVQDLVFYSSFEFPMLRRLKKVDPQAKFRVLLWEDTTIWRDIADELQPQAIHLYDQTVTQELVDDIKNENYELYVYTVNDKELGNTLLDMGVDGIFTDSLLGDDALSR
ncbi:MAG: hypothetical protein ATN35_02895 [Epulopiscium sp. Nele67-Bin004]|nr:MAG: hypothetical protein ATN35_02895 [Epulopiscium sp. Nele67-Bin004]